MHGQLEKKHSFSQTIGATELIWIMTEIRIYSLKMIRNDTGRSHMYLHLHIQDYLFGK